MLIQIITRQTNIPCILQSLVKDIGRLFGNFSFVTIKHVYRETNMIVDELAKRGHLMWI